jgi:hypothetical protein
VAGLVPRAPQLRPTSAHHQLHPLEPRPPGRARQIFDGHRLDQAQERGSVAHAGAQRRPNELLEGDHRAHGVPGQPDEQDAAPAARRRASQDRHSRLHPDLVQQLGHPKRRPGRPHEVGRTRGHPARADHHVRDAHRRVEHGAQGGRVIWRVPCVERDRA